MNRAVDNDVEGLGGLALADEDRAGRRRDLAGERRNGFHAALVERGEERQAGEKVNLLIHGPSIAQLSEDVSSRARAQSIDECNPDR